jgi:hypothetical protein
MECTSIVAIQTEAISRYLTVVSEVDGANHGSACHPLNVVGDTHSRVQQNSSAGEKGTAAAPAPAAPSLPTIPFTRPKSAALAWAMRDAVPLFRPNSGGTGKGDVGDDHSDAGRRPLAE